MVPASLLAALLLVTPSGLDRVLSAVPPDSLVRPLRALEQRMGRSQDAGEVALVLGQLHYARGEYRGAAETFGRAAARLDPSRKPEARYWQALSLLAVQRSTESRVIFEEVARASAGRRADALLGVSWSWEQAGRPERALEALETLLAGDPGEAAPAALERVATFAARLGRPDDARKAADRLRRDYPASVEAARLGPAPEAPIRGGSPVAVRLGAFSDPARARSLADRARRAGFVRTEVTETRSAGATLWVVRAGSWPTREEAEQAAKQIELALGVRPQLESAR